MLRKFGAFTPVLAMALSLSVHSQDKVIDVSGQNGQSGRDGTSGGYRGNGQDATHATRGQDAGAIDIQVSAGDGSDRKNGVIQIKGVVRTAGGSSRQVEESSVLGRWGKMILKAVGGRGGDGADGGDGSRGYDGRDGHSATEYSRGGNGTDGGPGYDGGRGTPGADGGRGGQVRVSLQEKDLDLLMLLDTDAQVRGGEGGRSGTNGRGGAGGQGGDGGRAYHGRRIRGYDKDRNPIYESVYQPGGFDGSDGRRGRDGNGNVHSGSSGANGDFQIYVMGANGPRSADTRFKLRLNSFVLRDEDMNKIIEPGERVFISQMRVQNTGELPTPSRFGVEIEVPGSQWYAGPQGHLEITKSLAPGESYDVPGELIMEVRTGFSPTASGRRFSARDQVAPKATQLGVERQYPEFNNVKDFEVTMPVEITEIEGPGSILPGQTAEIFWRVRNISGKDFGGGSELRRYLATTLKLDPSQVSTKSFVYYDARGNEVSLELGFINEITKLRAGESMIISGKIRVDRMAMAYSKVNLQSDLNLQTQQTGKQTVQRTKYLMSVAQVFHKTPGSRVLLVTNNHSTPEEVGAWLTLFDKHGLVADIWDTSFEGFLSFSRILNHTDKTLAEDFRGATVVVLNNDRPFKLDTSKQIQADAIIPKREILKACARHNIHFHFVGKTNAHYLEILPFFLLPSSEDPADNQKFTSLSAFKTALSKMTPKEGLLGHIVWNENFTFSSPKAENFKTQIAQLSEDLEEIYPNRRFYFIHQYSGAMTVDGYLSNTHRMGSVSVYESLEVNRTRMTAKVAGNERMHTKEFILGASNEAALLHGLSYDVKAETLLRKLTQQPEDASTQELLNAFLVGILHEQYMLGKKKNSMWESTAKKELIVLQQVLATLTSIRATLKAQPADSAASRAMIDLLARAKVGMQNWKSFYRKKNADGTKGHRDGNCDFSDAGIVLIDEWVEKNFGDGSFWADKGQKAIYNSAQAIFSGQVKAQTVVCEGNIRNGKCGLEIIVKPVLNFKDSRFKTDHSQRIMTLSDYTAQMDARDWVWRNYESYDKQREAERLRLNMSEGIESEGPSLESNLPPRVR